MRRRVVLLVLASLVVPASAGAATATRVPDPERAVDVPTQTKGNGFTYGFDAKRLADRVVAAGGRITAVDTTVVDGKRLHMLAFARNQGVMRRPQWWWDVGVSEATLLKRLKARGARIIDLALYVVDERVVSAVSIKNAGPAAKRWWWLRRLDAKDVKKAAEARGARIVDLEQEPDNRYDDKDGRYDVIAIRNAGVDERRWDVVLDDFNGIGKATADGTMRAQDVNGITDYVVVESERPPGAKPGWFSDLAVGPTRAEGMLKAFGGRPAFLDVYMDDAKDGLADMNITFAGVSDVPPATERIRYGVTMAAPPTRNTGESKNGKKPYPKFGMLLRRPGAPSLVSLNPDDPHETASSLKALHHAAITRIYEQQDLPLDKPADYRYQQFIGIPSCPTEPQPEKPFVEHTLADATAALLRQSDDGATAAIQARIGRDALFAYSRSLGMTSVQIGGVLGCFSRQNANLWTLDDATRLYAAILGGAVATKPAYVKHLRESFLDDNAFVQEGFAAAAMASAKPAAATHASLIDTRSKAGGYALGKARVATDAGYVILPVMTPGGVVRRPYFFGLFYDSDEGFVPAAVGALRRELIEVAIKDALETFPDA